MGKDNLLLGHIMDVKEGLARIEERFMALEKKAEAGVRAEERLTKHENRFWGWLIGISSASTAGGVAFGDAIKGVFKAIGSH
jgi:hypothetical protein